MRINCCSASDVTNKFNKVAGMLPVDVSNEGAHTAYINGYPDGTFKPNQSVRRSEMAAMLYRVNELSKPDGYKQVYRGVSESHWAALEIERLSERGWAAPAWPDVAPDHWAYGHVEEASPHHSFQYRGDGESFVDYQ